MLQTRSGLENHPNLPLLWLLVPSSAPGWASVSVVVGKVVAIYEGSETLPTPGSRVSKKLQRHGTILQPGTQLPHPDPCTPTDTLGGCRGQRE